MSPPRLLVPGPLTVPGARIALPDEERRHARSQRLRDGDEVTLLDGAGGRARATLADSGAVAVVGAPEEARGEPSMAVTVVLAAAEPARIEWALEKGTECGATAFVLWAAERSQRSHVTALAGRLRRLRRVVAEAAKQCDRTLVPSVTGVLDLAAAIADLPRPLLLASPGAPPLLTDGWAGGSIAIGPEGGVSPSEEEAFRGAGARFVGLGNRVLRLETAVAVVLARLVDGTASPGRATPRFG